MAYRAFWLDTKTGSSIELGRGVASEIHIQYVLEHPATFGFTGPLAKRMEQMAAGPVPYELTDYPPEIVKPLLSRWVKVRIDERYVNFTTTDRPTRRQLEAMQDFMVEKRFRQGVFLMGEPSGRILGRFTTPEEFMQVKQPGSLRRVAARTAVQVGQVWRRADGLQYRVAGRSSVGWYVEVGGAGNGRQAGRWGSDRLYWGFTDRQMHNRVVQERLRLVAGPPTVEVLAGRLRAAGLGSLAGALLAVGRTPLQERDERVRDAHDTELHLERQLDDADSPERRKRLRRELRHAEDILDTEGPRVEPPDRVSSPTHITDDRIAEPNKVTR